MEITSVRRNDTHVDTRRIGPMMVDMQLLGLLHLKCRCRLVICIWIAIVWITIALVVVHAVA